MLFATSGSSLWPQLLLFISAFVGPEQHNPIQAVRWERKIDALVLFAMRGDDEECKKVVADIRKWKDFGEDFVRLQQKTKSSSEAWMRGNKKPLTNNLSEEARQSTLESHRVKLQTIARVTAHWDRLNKQRIAEERAFSLLLEFLQKARSAYKTPPEP